MPKNQEHEKIGQRCSDGMIPIHDVAGYIVLHG